MYFLTLLARPEARTLPYRKPGDRRGYVTKEEAERRSAVVLAHYTANNPTLPLPVFTVVTPETS